MNKISLIYQIKSIFKNINEDIYKIVTNLIK